MVAGRADGNPGLQPSHEAHQNGVQMHYHKQGLSLVEGMGSFS